MLMAARNSQDLACCWARDRECALEVAFRFRRIRLRRLERDFSRNAIDLGLEPFFLGCFHRVMPSPMQRQASSSWPSSPWAAAKFDNHDGKYIVAPVDRHVAIPVAIISTAFEALPVRPSSQPRPNILTDAVEKGFSRVERIFSEALVPWSANDVGGHIISPISNQRPS